MDAIHDILDELRAGRMIVLVDDEQRENEGDLVLAAEHATPEAINFMLREARGMMCVALEGAICDRLGLEPQGRSNTALHGTAYTISVDAGERFGITTGVSAADRATTIRLLADAHTRPDDLVRPGHVQPLRARDGGCLVRTGQTEGSVDLCRLAGLTPAAVIIEVMNEDGTMARRPQLEKLCRAHNITICSVADLVHHRLEREQLVTRVETRPIETSAGTFELMVYHSLVDPLPHVALTCGQVGRRDATGAPVDIDDPVLVRMHSQNLLGDVFGDVTQPSGRTLERSMRMIQQAGRGAVVYLRHEGMGEGLVRRLQTTREGRGGGPGIGAGVAGATKMPGADAPGGATIGQASHHGAYGIGCQILRDLGVRNLRLITSHPFTPTALHGFGLSIKCFVRPE
ncbi:MAG: 3,4-dihydroxy-2-butanone-4-phosphate synthase [Phycisphaeraceae bacterium]